MSQRETILRNEEPGYPVVLDTRYALMKPRPHEIISAIRVRHVQRKDECAQLELKIAHHYKQSGRLDERYASVGLTREQAMAVAKELLGPGYVISHDLRPYVTVTSGMRGWFAVMMHWNTEIGDREGFWEPLNTGETCKTYADAVVYGKNWAAAENVEFRA